MYQTVCCVYTVLYNDAHRSIVFFNLQSLLGFHPAFSFCKLPDVEIQSLVDCLRWAEVQIDQPGSSEDHLSPEKIKS